MNNKINSTIMMTVALMTVLLVATQPLVFAEKMSDQDRYQSGFEHGCSDSHIEDPYDRYINQKEKGFSYHTSSFNDGYRDGFGECGYDGGVLVEKNSGVDNSFNNRDSVVQPQSQGAVTTQSAGCPSQIINGDCIIGQEQKTHNEFAQASRADN